MRIIIETIKTGGLKAYNDPDDPCTPELIAVGKDLPSLCSELATKVPSTAVLNEWAEMISACDPSSDQPRVFHMVKLLRAITGCGLKEACDALREYL